MDDERDRRLQQRRSKRRKNELIMKCIIVLLLIIVIVLAVILTAELISTRKEKAQRQAREQQLIEQQGGGQMAGGAASQSGDAQTDVSGTGSQSTSDNSLKSQADQLAAQYDYDGAIQLLQSAPGYDSNAEYQSAVAEYQQTKASCVSYPIDQITHVFSIHWSRTMLKRLTGMRKRPGTIRL